MKIVEISREELEQANTKKDFKALLKKKYDAAKDKELKKKILGVE